MFVTQFKKLEDNLIPHADVSEKLSNKSSNCSCKDCDYIDCFEKRNKTFKYRCQCTVCRDRRVCSILPNGDNRVNKRDLQSAKKNIIRKVVTTHKTENLKKVTETMYGYDSKQNVEMITETESKCKEKRVTMTPTRSRINSNMECCTDRSFSEIADKNQCRKQRSISSDINQSHQVKTARTLSAQVMNLPYEDLQESMPSSHELTKLNPLPKLNIFQRIKEIYDACSCKVCECISSKPLYLRDDVCTCKPCQCEDCVKSRKFIEEETRRVPHSGCPCIRCERTDCKGIAKEACEPQICQCNTSGSMLYSKHETERCKCDPCQCIECTAGQSRSRTVRLGNVNEIVQRQFCQCSPCECIECKHIYNHTHSRTRSENKTKYDNYRRNNCLSQYCQLGKNVTYKSETHKAMKKSFDKNYNDYDIRTLIVDNSGPFNQLNQCNFQEQTSVALVASLKSEYPSNSCNKTECKCTECECIVCSAKDNELLGHNVMVVHEQFNHNKLPTQITNACKCTPCECQICSTRERVYSKILESKCRCDVCDCINCESVSLATSSLRTSSGGHPYRFREKLPIKRIRSMDMNKNCHCNPCDCKNCENLYSCSSSVTFYSNRKNVNRKTARRVKKVLLVTPSTSESQLKSRKAELKKHTSPKCHTHSYAAMSKMQEQDLQSTNENQVYQLYKKSGELRNNPDLTTNREIFLNSNNAELDSASFKSTEETEHQRQVKHSQPKYKRFNVNHEQSDIISSNSDETLPIFWTCSNEMLYPIRLSQNICKKSNVEHNLNGQLNNSQFSNVQKDYVNVKAIETSKDHFQSISKDLSNDGEIFTEYAGHTYCIETHKESCDNDYSHKYTNSFSNSVSDDQEYKTCIVNYSGVTIDYERAKTILREAKAFSSKLINMLDSFETANRQFESASLKFKTLHESLLNINQSELNMTYSANLKRISRPTFNDHFEIISQDQPDIRQLRDEGIKNENQAEREYEQTTTKPEDVLLFNDFQYAEESNLTNYETLQTKEINEEKYDVNTQRKEIDALNDISLIRKSNSLLEYDKVIDKASTSLVHNSDIIKVNLNRDDVKSEAINEIINNNGNINAAPTEESVVKKLHSVISNITTSDTAVTTDDVENHMPELFKQEDKHWPIFRKNLYLNPCPVKRTTYKYPTFESEIKAAVNAISLQTTRKKDMNDIPRSIEFLNKFHLAHKCRPVTASSQTYDSIIKTADKEVYFNTDTETNNVSCEQFKARFIGLRRISDHTVLVKWNAPKRIADVQGYELLVDGRAVQNILSPSRRMAVMTCLPHAARVLLTIRTIVTADCGHAPASTIVYRPTTK